MPDGRKNVITVKFNGSGSVTVPAGGSIKSDIIDFRDASNAKVYVGLTGEAGHGGAPTKMEVLACGNVKTSTDWSGNLKIEPDTDFWESNTYAQTNCETRPEILTLSPAPKLQEPMWLNYNIDKYWANKAQFIELKFTNGDTGKPVKINFVNIVFYPADKRCIVATFGNPASKSVTVPPNSWIKSNIIDFRNVKRAAVSLTVTPHDSYGSVFFTNIFICNGPNASAQGFWSMQVWDDYEYVPTPAVKETRVCYFLDSASITIDSDDSWDENPPYIQVGLESQDNKPIEVHEVRVIVLE